ncbi:MAG: oxygen-independent coproporphyrinogen III oxidase [Betaproteobacteria bacterium]|nr:oxygen-independent coproporphyrinogen III oxidase [Betaproteobacteria bacterium]
MIAQAPLVIDPDVLQRFGYAGPRYTSYPTADRFVEAFGEESYRTWLEKRGVGGMSRPLSLYVHLPFCDTVCFYCACNKIVTKDRSRAAKYLRYLAREAELVSAHLEGDRRLCQLHFGGGTPTFLPPEQLRELFGILSTHFRLVPEGEYSIEIDPRSTAPGTLTMLAELGMNRVSIGVQDFDPEVQRAVNRIQSEAVTRAAIDEARAAGYRSVNLDLIYGLPRQNVDGFMRTLDTTIGIAPNRIALYSYAHLPHVFKPQRRIQEKDLPAPELKLQMLINAIRRLSEAGYVYIGMDHFARPDDELAVAQRQGRLHRNFQGYSTHAECDLVALGVTAIGNVGPTYSQNVRTLEEYYDRLDRGVMPVFRGVELSADDLLRRAIIQSLMCHGSVSIEAIELAYLIDFKAYFSREIESLQPFVDDGLVEIDGEWVAVTPRGRLLVRAICMVFDRYLQSRQRSATYSKVI